ncbi:MAG: hypothetical protein GEV03_22445 [Streptosporangiales bacterium]|nr:hypothetical protein [Streptosporangiales bacterium]
MARALSGKMVNRGQVTQFGYATPLAQTVRYEKSQHRPHPRHHTGTMSNETEILPALNEDSFDIVMRGYNRQQVDEYLTRTKQQIQGLEQRLAQAMNEAQETRREGEKARQELAATKKQLEGAEPSYDELGERLSQILKLADQEAASKKTNADSEAERVRKAAEEDAKRIVADAQGQVQRVESAARERVDKLLHHHTDLVRRLTNVRDSVVELLKDEDAAPLVEDGEVVSRAEPRRDGPPQQQRPQPGQQGQPGPQGDAQQQTPTAQAAAAQGAQGAQGAQQQGGRGGSGQQG